MDLFAVLISGGYAPFLLAGSGVAAILILEMLGLVVGHSFLGMDLDFDLDAGAFATAADWLHLGKVPAIIVITLLLAGFAVGGAGLQLLLSVAMSGGSPWLAGLGGAAISGLFTHSTAKILAKFLPLDETSSISTSELLGNTAVMLGSATHGHLAQAKVVNHLGETLYVFLEPDHSGEELIGGTEVVLTKQLSMNRFYATPVPRLPDLETSERASPVAE